MQTFSDLLCIDCNTTFESASLLLGHFASHVRLNLGQNEETESKNDTKQKKTSIPDLYPIANLRLNKSEAIADGKDENVDSGFEEINPLKFCLVTMDDKLLGRKQTHTDREHDRGDNSEINKPETPKKFTCTYCPKMFGWTTDLKRHILIHTGERPFKCQHCNCSFTRNFLLQKHKLKFHPDIVSKTTTGKVEIPPLTPIRLKSKSYMQGKHSGKRKSCETKRLCQAEDDFFSADNLIYSM